MFNALKDRVTGNAARHYCNTLLARYGTVQELRIDSARQSLDIVCLLAGETVPIAIAVEKYAITDEDGKKFVQVTASRCARPWVQHFIEDHIHGRKFPLPAVAAAAL